MPRRGRSTDATGRNSGPEQYLKLPYSTVRSPAWRSLSGPAVKVFLELRCRFNGGNNGDLSLSLDEASKLLGLGKATAQRAFAELVDKGFIVLIHRGKWVGRMAATYRTTDKQCNGEPPTRDWTRWSPAPAVARIGSQTDHSGRVVVLQRTTATLRGPPENPSDTENAA